MHALRKCRVSVHAREYITNTVNARKVCNRRNCCTGQNEQTAKMNRREVTETDMYETDMKPYVWIWMIIARLLVDTGSGVCMPMGTI